jgi:hypothetical protein
MMHQLNVAIHALLAAKLEVVRLGQEVGSDDASWTLSMMPNWDWNG